MAMTCEEIEREDVAEDYVLGRLDESRRQAFEDHYFECAACLAHVRAVQDLRGALAAPAAAPARRNLRTAGVILAAAAVLVLAVRGGHQLWSDRQEAVSSTTAPRDIVLGAPPAPTVRVELPPYTPARLRAVPSAAQSLFRDAMTHYTVTNCAGAIDGLRRAVAADRAYTQARFYLGACELHTGATNEAATSLQRVIAAGESPYLEDARWFLAQARVKQGDLEAARQELERVIALNGDRREAARRLLDELRR